ncbi:MAG: hypothetical protein KKA07_04845 [Bacteroidetes bacterium]|nr:hypothetical protein [Bacteroidota bacterium]MBU1718379.1 hypothetical protein [Bacteroidota bacterium]
MKCLFIGDSMMSNYASASTAGTKSSVAGAIAGMLNQRDFQEPDTHYCGLPVSLEEIIDSFELYSGFGSRRKTLNFVSESASDIYQRKALEFDDRIGFSAKKMSDEKLPYFHNLSICGSTMADLWTLTSRVCNKEHSADARCQHTELPISGFYKAAGHVLNPKAKKDFQDFSALKWLEYHHLENPADNGVENLVVWAGTGNILNTIIDMVICPTPGSEKLRPHHLETPDRRAMSWNLYHPSDFEAEYSELLERIDKVMSKNSSAWKVVLCNIPHITIFPFIKGVGKEFSVSRNGKQKTYFKYYTYFPFEYECAFQSSHKLTLKEVLLIDETIDSYNASIQLLVEKMNKRHKKNRYHIADINSMLDQIAIKRNGYAVKFNGYAIPSGIFPVPDTKFYYSDESGSIKQGGIFSLDGVHFSSYGKAMIAKEILCYISKYQSGQSSAQQASWANFIRTDRLFSNPPKNLYKVYEDPAISESVVNMIIQAFPG